MICDACEYGEEDGPLSGYRGGAYFHDHCAEELGISESEMN